MDVKKSQSELKKLAKKTDRKKGKSQKLLKKHGTIKIAMFPTKKMGHCKHDRNGILQAFELVHNKRSSIRKAAKLCGIPEATLRRYLKKGTAIVNGSGSPPLLPLDEEKLLKEHILNLAKMGTILSQSEIITLATNTAVSLELKKESSNSLSIQWYRHFIKRWPELEDFQKSKKPVSTSEETANNYYNALNTIMEKYDLTEKPHLVFYFDEMCFHVDCEPHFTYTGEREMSLVDSSLLTTVMSVGSAVGQYIPPYFICNGSKSMLDLKANALPGSCYCVTESGCSNRDIFMDYLESHLLKYIPTRSNDQFILLLYHCQTPYISGPIFELALMKNIVLFGLPPQDKAPPEEEPLIVSSFDELKNTYLAEFQAQISGNQGELTQRHQLCKLVSGAYLHAFTPHNLISAFSETGLCPISKRKIQLLYSSHSSNNLLNSEKTALSDTVCEKNQETNTV